MSALLLSLVSSLLGVDTATADERLPVPDARPVLLAALHAPDGRASGLLGGELADAIGRRFGSSAAIHVDVSTVHRYAQPGCSRLNVTFRQDDVQLPGAAAPQRQTIEFGIDYCLDGQPPASREILR